MRTGMSSFRRKLGVFSRHYYLFMHVVDLGKLLFSRGAWHRKGNKAVV